MAATIIITRVLKTMEDRTRFVQEMRSLPFQNKNVQIKLVEVDTTDGVERRNEVTGVTLFCPYVPRWARSPNSYLHIQLFVNEKTDVELPPSIDNITPLWG